MRNSASFRVDVTPVKRIGCFTMVGIGLLVLIVIGLVIKGGKETKRDNTETPTVPMPSIVVAETAPGETAAPAKPQKIFLGEHVAAYKKYSAQEYNPQIGSYFTMGGTPFYRGLTLSSRSDGCYAYYNLGAYGFHTMKGQVGCLDKMDTKAQGTLSFYGDDVLLKQIELRSDKLPTNFEIDITEINQLRINCVSIDNGRFALAGLADVIFE